MTELEQYLRSYMGVSDEDMRALVSVFYPMTLEKGDYFLKAGRVCDKLSFQREGLIRAFAGNGGKEVTQWIFYRGTLVTDLQGLLCDEPSRFAMQALSHCELYTIDKKDYLELHRRAGKWPALERVLITRCFGFMEMRVFSLLSMSGEERYSYLQGQNPDLFETVPLKYLASMMGMTPESLSRIRKKKVK
jgi:CRP-like cAMP-binding protein